MSAPTVKLDRILMNPFLDGPAQFVVKTVTKLISEVPQFSKIFGEYIDAYMRTDYPATALPALRIYDQGWRKESESWFIEGDLTLDVIWPNSLRRVENQQMQDTIASALVQQFRRITFFNEVETAEREEDALLNGFKLLGVPGLNELGKRFSVDKTLGFQLSEDQVAPLTQIKVNFKVDLREWDRYLEANLRTKDDPFKQTLAELDLISCTIEAYRLETDAEPEVTIDLDVDTSTED